MPMVVDGNSVIDKTQIVNEYFSKLKYFFSIKSGAIL
jgi:hypothetical protein